MKPDGLLIFNVLKTYINFYLFMLVYSTVSFYSIHDCCLIKKKEDNKASVLILFILLSVRIH